jgi:hypothetical protein
VSALAFKPQVLDDTGYTPEETNRGMKYNVKFDDNSVLGLLHYVVVGDVADVL